MKTLALAALAVTVAFAGNAEARAPIAPAHAGTLSCNFDPGLGLVLGSVRQVDCTYEHINRRGRIVRESYVGTMGRIGIDLGLTGPQSITWNVTTMGGRNRRGMMAGPYNGSFVEGSLFAGPGTQAMFAEQGRGITLERTSQSGQVGFGLAFGAAGFELTQVPNATFSSLR